MRVRVARLADAEALRDLYRVLNTALPVGNTAAVRGVITHPGTRIFVSEDNGMLQSMATLHVLPNVTYEGRPYALIENVATLPPHQGAGLGRAVMTHAIQAAWASGVYKIMLMTGRANAAKEFYEKLGFDSTEKWPMVLRRPDGVLSV